MAGAFGAAMCAAVGLGIYKNFESVKDFVTVEQRYVPREENDEIYDKLFKSYKTIYYALEKAYKELNASRF